MTHLHNPAQSASPVSARVQRPRSLPSSTSSSGSALPRVPARPRSLRGPGGCASRVAHRHAGCYAVPSWSGADRPEDTVTESLVPGAGARATGLQRWVAAWSGWGRGGTITTTAEAPLCCNLRPSLRRALPERRRCGPEACTTHAFFLRLPKAQKGAT